MLNAAPAINGVGMVTSVGLNAAGSAAAIRANVRNMSETAFYLAGDDPLVAAQVTLERPWRGHTKLTKMLAMCVTEALESVATSDRQQLPLLLCTPERDRVSHLQAAAAALIRDLENETGLRFSAERSRVFPFGRAAGLVALEHARRLVVQDNVSRVLIAGVDSLLNANALRWLDDRNRLLSEDNSNGFIPGEGAGCVLVESTPIPRQALVCAGIGLAEESVTIFSGEPFRADGLTRAIALAVQQAGVDISVCDVRLTDLAGEHYYFREAALALSRLLRREGCRELWHPAECIGEVGAAVGPILLGYAAIALRKGYLTGSHVLIHATADSGVRAAACLSVMGEAGVE